MERERFEDDGRAVAEYAGLVLVRCPRCDACAVVTRAGLGSRATVVCGACAYSSTKERVRKETFGAPIDPVFGLPLWLTAPFRGETVWAYNAEHLAFLRDWVGADLRRRLPGHHHSMASRLPAWMTSAKNRAGVLAVIAELEARLEP